jgi:ABC-type nitrate/sulfonate/bicarbonate transport system substrate-binding protein
MHGRSSSRGGSRPTTSRPPPSDFAARAGRAALAAAGLTPDEIDMIVVLTPTPDSPQPPAACLVPNLLGAGGALAERLAGMPVGEAEQYVGDLVRRETTTAFGVCACG